MADQSTTPDRPKSRNITELWRLFRFLWPYRWHAIGASIALLIASGAVLAVPQAVRLVIDLGFGSHNTEALNFYFIALFGVVAMMAAATFVRFYLVSRVGERVVADIRNSIYGHILELSPEFFETTKTGEVLSRLTTDTTLIQTVIGSSISMALRNALMMTGGTVLLIVTSPKLAGLVLLIVPLVVLPLIFFGRRVRVLSRESQDRIADISAYAGESIDAIQTVQSFNHEPVDRGFFGQGVENAFNTAVARVRTRGILIGLVMLLCFGAVDAVMWVGGLDVFAGRMTAGELTAFVVYSVFVASAVGALSETWGELQRAAGAAERLLELLDTQPTVKTAPSPVALPVPAKGALSLTNVTFSYPARPELPSLVDFSLDVQPGETVALVGPSGAGKSTVFQLILRFFDPHRGIVRLDGVDITQALPAELRDRIGLVPQDPVIFAANATENIRYGRPNATDAEVRAAAEAASATGFLDRLPQGFNTFLGEKGIRLSGGERQRIAIARAILRDPAILLLDEATSALDAESERDVQKALERLMEGRTTLVIAHRLATVLKADRIVVLDRGHIVASGKHKELVAQGGLYARLSELQFDVARGLIG